MKFKISFRYSKVIEGKDEYDAVEKFWERLDYGNEDAGTFLTDIMSIEEYKPDTLTPFEEQMYDESLKD